jgi:hypothetical protein
VTALELAIVFWPSLAELRHLEGWTWQRGGTGASLDEAGLCGYRQLGASGMWMDVLWIFGLDDAHAARCMVGGPMTWTSEGTVDAVLIALAELPHPGQPGAPLTAINVGLPVAAIALIEDL